MLKRGIQGASERNGDEEAGDRAREGEGARDVRVLVSPGRRDGEPREDRDPDGEREPGSGCLHGSFRF